MKRNEMSISKPFLITALMLAAACGGAKDAPEPSDVGAPAADGAPAGPAATGNVIVIEMTTDEKGSYYAPKDITAKPGDVLRFTLVTGVHNANFVADSNAGVSNLPPATDLLQLPGQTVDVVVPNAPGKTLYFHCDPHAALGMIGHVKVES